MALKNDTGQINYAYESSTAMQTFGIIQNDDNERKEEQEKQLNATSRGSPFWQTVLIIVSFIGLVIKYQFQFKKATFYNFSFNYAHVKGITDNVRGPALLDLGEVYDSSISAVSGLFLAAFVGSLCGSLFGKQLFVKTVISLIY